MRKKKLTERFVLKVFAYFVTVISFCVTVAASIGCIFLAGQGFYQKSLEEMKIAVMQDYVMDQSYVILGALYEGDTEGAYDQCRDTNLKFQVLSSKGIQEVGNYEGRESRYVFKITRASDIAGDNMLKIRTSTALSLPAEQIESRFFNREGVTYLGADKTLYVYVDEALSSRDGLNVLISALSWIYAMRFYLVAIAGGCLILCIISFIFQMCSAGRKYEEDTVTAQGLAGLPFDLLTCGMMLLLYWMLCLGYENLYRSVGVGGIVSCAVIAVVACVLGIGYCLIWAIQVKAKIWWRHMVICRLLQGILRLLRTILKGLFILYRNLPDLLRVILAVLIVLVLEGNLFLVWGADARDIFLVWLLEKLLLIPLILYITLVIRRLQRASESLAEGDLSYQVDTRYMVGELKEHGENLNRIAEGMNAAVNERLKSERLKTELITNVSHDIKTPLTSIINYADLIGEEPTENTKITEYARILQRHSARLKKLIEDLMEASKASTGNVELHMAPCEVGVLLTQTVGEYEQRLEEQGLELITRKPTKPVSIMADGKLLWRIFDNLMNNVCKYAMKGTRVYLTMEECEGKVWIAFKNISRYQLEITAEELMERFVRGDRSRATEGNGLGLSITQSLTQLQGGQLHLTVDGDFFKAVLEFDALAETQEKVSSD